MAEEEMKHKKDLRRAQRAVITKTIKVVDDLVKGSPLEEARLRQKKSVLIDKCNTVKALDQEILLAAPADELEAEIERADEVQEYIELAIALIDETLAAATTSTALEDTRPVLALSHTPPPASTVTLPSTRSPPPTRTPLRDATPPLPTGRSSSTEGPPAIPLTVAYGTPTTHTSVVATVPTTSVHPRVKLPELTPKRFNGDLTKWATFWDTFKSSVHDNPAINTSRQVHLSVIFAGTASSCRVVIIIGQL